MVEAVGGEAAGAVRIVGAGRGRADAAVQAVSYEFGAGGAD